MSRAREMVQLRKKVVFVSSTRADFGKIKALILALNSLPSQYDVHVFATGMHLDSKYGFTVLEFEKCGISQVHRFTNHSPRGTMDEALARTIEGFGQFARQLEPDLIVVHGDRPEALAGVIVGSFNNILVAHIEGGELSGTLDGVLRHSISKMSHLHFVANRDAKRRLLQMGETPSSIYCIGSPDIDLMSSPHLPPLHTIKKHYQISFEQFGILLLHPVTSEVTTLATDVAEVSSAILASGLNWIVLFPNSDRGSDIILDEYAAQFSAHSKFRVFPSVRFEAALVLLRHAQLIVGNSSMGIREAPYYGTPTVNIGTRQLGRSNSSQIQHCPAVHREIERAISHALRAPRPKPQQEWGTGDSHKRFLRALSEPSLWTTSVQKQFVDVTTSRAELPGDTEPHATPN